MTGNQDGRDEDTRLEALLERSSLGTPGAKQLRARIPLARKLLVAYDIEGYARLGSYHADEVQQQLVEVLTSALGEAQLAPSTYEMQEQGDGGLVLLPAGENADKPRLIASLINAVDSQLHRVNEHLHPNARIRLRIALDEGAVYRTAHGYAGPAVVTVCRLRDAAAVRDMLSNSAGHLVVVTTDRLYEDILANAPGWTFTQADVTIKEKGFAASAWAYLPGAALPALPAVAEPRVSAPLTARARRRTISGTSAGAGGTRELTVQEASVLAIDAHDGQLEMYGAPYHEHLRVVAEALTPYGPHLVMAGWLHDILEGTEWTARELREAGVPARVVEIVELVTPGSDYLSSIRRITQDPQATLVKIADNADSIHPERLTGTPDAETRRRLAEFEEARLILWPAARREDIITVVSPINRPLLDRLTVA